MLVTQALRYFTETIYFSNNSVKTHMIKLSQNENHDLTLLLSKVSEAILPNTVDNHIGEGTDMNNYLNYQKGVRFIINGGFNHYRKNFYAWPHQNFEIGNPVGLVKIREHYFEDYLDLEYYGFLTQTQKGENWTIKKPHELNKEAKYILGCTPLLIYEKEKVNLPPTLMNPLKTKEINPPSVLAHGLQNHPRTAVASKDNDLYFILVESPGCTLLDLQQMGLNLNFDMMLNLDGGGSSQFRLIENNLNIIQNKVLPEDSQRVLGHVIVLFDETLK